jgi:IS30 family transposase
MDQNHFNTDEAVRKSGSHLTLAERGMIQALHREGMSLRDIAKNIGLCPYDNLL